MTFKGLEVSAKPRKLRSVDDINWCAVMSMINFNLSQNILVIMLLIGTFIMKTLMFDDIKTGKTKLEMIINFSIVDS